MSATGLPASTYLIPSSPQYLRSYSSDSAALFAHFPELCMLNLTNKEGVLSPLTRYWEVTPLRRATYLSATTRYLEVRASADIHTLEQRRGSTPQAQTPQLLTWSISADCYAEYLGQLSQSAD